MTTKDANYWAQFTNAELATECAGLTIELNELRSALRASPVVGLGELEWHNTRNSPTFRAGNWSITVMLNSCGLFYAHSGIGANRGEFIATRPTLDSAKSLAARLQSVLDGES